MQLTTDKIRELLDYNEDTGVFTWKARANKAFNARLEGLAAGTNSIGATGYPSIYIRFNKERYLASRLAFLWMGIAIPEQVDHKDRDSTNNRWINLEASNSLDNSRNRSKSRANSSGVTGVTWNKASNKWKAQVRVKSITKFLGYFDYDDLDLAAMEAMEFRAEHGFSPGHGLQRAAYANG